MSKKTSITIASLAFFVAVIAVITVLFLLGVKPESSVEKPPTTPTQTETQVQPSEESVEMVENEDGDMVPYFTSAPTAQ